MANGIPWYMYPHDAGSGQYGSYPDPMGAYAKPDINIGVPANVPITSITKGVVTDVSWGKPWSGSVVVKLDKPPNNFAQYAGYNFLRKISVMPGQKVNVGTLIGYPGQSINFAFGYTNATPWGAGYFGRVADPRLDPRPAIASASGGGGFTFNLGLDTGNAGFTAVAQTSHDTLNNVPGFQGLVEALDIVEQFQPFTLPDNSGIIGKIPGIGEVINTLQFPSDAMQGFLMFVTSNTMAALVRLGFILLGVIILGALIQNAVHQSTIDVTGQSPGDLAGSAMKIGAAALPLML